MTPTLRTALQGLVKTYRQTAYALEHTTGHYSEEARAYDRCSDQLEAILTAHPEASGEARTCATCNVHKRRIEGVYQ